MHSNFDAHSSLTQSPLTLVIDGFDELKGCCLNTIVLNPLKSIGDRKRCHKCDNLLIAKESRLKFINKSKEFNFKSKMFPVEGGIGIALVSYSKPLYCRNQAEKDALSKGIDLKYITETTESITIVQNVASKFEKCSITTHSPEMGITLVLGKLK